MQQASLNYPSRHLSYGKKRRFLAKIHVFHCFLVFFGVFWCFLVFFLVFFGVFLVCFSTCDHISWHSNTTSFEFCLCIIYLLHAFCATHFDPYRFIRYPDRIRCG